MEDYSLIGIIKTLHKWRKPIVYSTAGIAALSVVVSLLLPTYYQARTIFYAASQDLTKPQKVLGYSMEEAFYYGSGEDIERVLTISNSSEVLDYLINTYRLYDHYDIDSSGVKARYKVREKLLNLYEVNRTKYDALELTIEDRNPEMAAILTNAARDKINESISGIIKNNQKREIDAQRKAISRKEDTLAKILDTLSALQLRSGIIDPEVQAEELAKTLQSSATQLMREKARLDSYERSAYSRQAIRDSMKANIAGLEEQIRVLTDPDSSNISNYSLSRFNVARGKVLFLSDEASRAISAIGADREQVKRKESVYNMDVPALHLVEEAQVPLIKHRPKRSLLVISATFAAFLFLTVGALLVESVKTQDWSFLKW